MGQFGKTGRFLAGALMSLALVAAPATALAQESVIRLGGDTRYDTMSTIVSEGFGTSTWAVVATGDDYPDALAASALAGARRCPVILTQGGALSPQARHLLKLLGTTNVYLMGGTAAVAPAVEAELEAMGISVTRVAGDDRVATSVETMRKLQESNSVCDTVVIATGYNFADALSVGPWVYHTMSPLVLNGRDGRLSDEAVEAIKSRPSIRNVVIVGGTAAVSADVEAQLGDGYTYRRIAGADRYDTSAQVATWALQSGLSWVRPAVATGTDFPDALAGAALCGRNASPLLLVGGGSTKATDLLAANASSVGGCFILGGEAAVPETIATSVKSALGSPSTTPTPTATYSPVASTYSRLPVT